jgi:hypothetical protein
MVRIKGFLPNPIGRDSEGEYVVLINESREAVNISGWTLTNARGKKFILSGVLEVGEEINLGIKQTKVNLVNTGETVSLFDSVGNLVDQLGYVGNAIEGRMILKNSELTEELRLELMDELAKEDFLAQPRDFIGSVFLGVFLALILTGIGMYVIKSTKQSDYE